MTIEFIGKSLLITEDNERVLIVSDLHMGYGQSLREGGVMLPTKLYENSLKEFEEIFRSIGNVEKVIILGDLKHEMGSILKEEWSEVLGLMDYLKNSCGKLVVIKGNHDIFTRSITEKRGVQVVDFYIWKGYCFLHGDRDFKEIYSEEINCWVLGHAHPAISLNDGAKSEKYKCFLLGNYKGKKIIILPSWFSVNEGTDVKILGKVANLGLAWNFNLDKF